MLRKISKFRENALKKVGDLFCGKGVANKSGQVAIILILITALALILYAVTMNINRTARTMTVVTIASNVGAAKLGSQIASYGQQLYATNLGSENPYCRSSSTMEVVLGVIIAVIALVIAIFSEGTGSYISLALISLALSLVTVVINATILEPALTEMWNNQLLKNLPLEQRFLEQGIQSGVIKAIQDPVKVPDIYDFDQDMKWGIAANGVPRDSISRYGYYYTQRLLSVQAPQILTAVTFFRALADLMDLTGPTDFGLFDDEEGSYCSSNGVTISECNPCCLDSESSDFYTRPEECLTTDSASAECFEYTPFKSSSIVSPDNESFVRANWSWVYDAMHFNPMNNFDSRGNEDRISFLEELGLDDTHAYFCKDPGDVTNVRTSDAVAVNGFQQPADGGDGNFCEKGFRAQDATGFYSDKTPGVRSDPQVGIFPSLYMITQWGLDLNSVPMSDDVAYSADIVNEEQCYWLSIFGDDFVPNCHGFVTTDTTTLLTDELRSSPRLNLPINPVIAGNHLEKQFFPRVDGTNSNWAINDSNLCDAVSTNPDNTTNSENCSWESGNPPIALDRITPSTDSIGLIGADESECAEDNVFANGYVLDETDGGVARSIFDTSSDLMSKGFWKPGMDMFCSTNWQYTDNCPATACGENTGDIDILDDVASILREFARYAQGFVEEYTGDEGRLLTEITTWYNEMAYWIEPPSDSGYDYPYCYNYCEGATPDRRSGLLWIALAEIREAERRLTEWLNTATFASSVGGNGENEVWCVPPENITDPTDSNFTRSWESGDYDFNYDFDGDGSGDGERGDVFDVIECLSRNLGYSSAPNEVYSGNSIDQTFDTCNNSCQDFGIMFPDLNPDNLDEMKLNAYRARAYCGRYNMPRSLFPGFNPLDDFVPPSITRDATTLEYSGELSDLIDCKTTCLENVNDSLSEGYEACVADVSCDSTTEGTSTCACKRDYCIDACNDLNGDCETLCSNDQRDCLEAWFGVDDGDQLMYGGNCQTQEDACLQCATDCTDDYNNAVDTCTADSGTCGAAYLVCIQPCSHEDIDCRVSCGIDRTACSACVATADTNYTTCSSACNTSSACSTQRASCDDAVTACTDSYNNCNGDCSTELDTCLNGSPQGYAGGSPWTPGCNRSDWWDACESDCFFDNGGADALTATCEVGSVSLNCATDVLASDEAPSLGSTSFGSGPSVNYYDAIVDRSGSCSADNVAPGGIYTLTSDTITSAQIGPNVYNEYPNLISRSYNESQNQVAKMQQRVLFLKSLFWRNYPEYPQEGRVQDIIGTLAEADNNLTAFLVPEDSPSQQLIHSMVQYELAAPLPYSLIYGWQDAPDDDTGERGLWHFVQADARQPGRCDGACSIYQSGSGEPAFPRVITYTKGILETTRCYELAASRAVVKFSVARFDESRPGENVLFPNGVPIWSFRGSPKSLGIDLENITNYCGRGSSDLDDQEKWIPSPPAGLSPEYDTFEGAFMLNRRSENSRCWDLVKQILSHGVKSETCMEYYYHRGSYNGMSMKFVPCLNAF